ncbi:glycoside hydrolase superfamily [Lasiosphaeris hirsuta]|uniref:Glycoside hydrolase superfamily n=1 Tax=Lasiosphaeris hirsuta TaxID=260670 RepID=A0AA40DIW6_9PEZI|nr:glycoside hydrolase superfamily [Lasiosphaeris hirsuta]
MPSHLIPANRLWQSIFHWGGGLVSDGRNRTCQIFALSAAFPRQEAPVSTGRERISLNLGWRFQRSTTSPDNLSYTKLKQWILPSANNFIVDTTKQARRPADQPDNVTIAQPSFDDSSWEKLNLPHDWAVKGPFYTGSNAVIGGGMGRLPIQGVGWYRRSFSATATDKAKSVYLDIDGAMSYAMVWLNGKLVGGWPYGYASFRLDLTPYLSVGDNYLAIRLDNAVDSSRFYPGAGIYRNVWLTKVSTTHVGQTGTWISSKQVSNQSATLDLVVQVENAATGGAKAEVDVTTDVHIFDPTTGKAGEKVAQFPSGIATLGAGQSQSVNSSVTVQKPRLWGPRPAQEPNLYVAITRLRTGGQVIDTYETRFGIRSLQYGNDGLRINGQPVYLQGVNQHHDLGPLGSAFSVEAAERQLSMLQDMGCNAIRTSHNPPAPELLDLADQKGILILDEIFDTWKSQKVRNDFHLIFNDWYEADLRAFLRRDRNHPSVVIWSYGNEVSEQGGGKSGADTAQRLEDIVREEDPTRQTTVGMNSATADSAFSSVVDLIGLNYQGEGRTGSAGSFSAFRSKFPNKMIFSTESASAISSRGTYLFPVTSASSSAVKDGQGGDSKAMYVSAYELYAVDWGASADKVFVSQDRAPYVAGEFVWTGWDYLGEPTPYNSARSSYFGIIDLAGFPKDRFYLYQARWNPNVKMAHILPHWTWPDRVGQVTPVHVFSSGDEAELFLNGVSQGRQKRDQSNYRFRWDKIAYQPGELQVTTYKDGAIWANATVRTARQATQLKLSAYRDRSVIRADGSDLAFISVTVTDDKGNVVPQASGTITFSVQGPGTIVATDNGDPTDMVPFPSKDRKAFAGLALAIIRANEGTTGTIAVKATGTGVQGGGLILKIA